MMMMFIAFLAGRQKTQGKRHRAENFECIHGLFELCRKIAYRTSLALIESVPHLMPP